MIEITTAWVGPFIIVLGVTLRKHLLKYLKKEGVFANIVYVLLLLLISFPFYYWQYKFTFTSLDDKSAKELVQKVLQNQMFSKYQLNTLAWKPYSKEKNLYNIKANITDNKNHMFVMYLQPTCTFKKGCQVTLEKIIILNSKIKNIPISQIDKDFFTHRSCSDEIIKQLIVNTNIKPFFKALFAKWDSLKVSQASYKIEKLYLSDFKHTDMPIQSMKRQAKQLNNSCQANLHIKGDFSIQHNGKEATQVILQSMFDKVKKHQNYYTIDTKLFYDIYTDPNNGTLKYNTMFVDLKKMKHSVKKVAAVISNKK